MTLPSGERIGRFQVEEAIASGGFSVVYRARDLRLDHLVAVKVLADNYAFDPEVRARFADEARTLRAIDSDAVITVFDLGETDAGQPYLVMSYADRGTLADRIEAGQRPTSAELSRVVTFLGDALGAMHRGRLIHRDVKPSNILIRADDSHTPSIGRQLDSLLRSDDHLLLADFGLVKDLTAGSGYTAGAGSTGYAAPEQLAVGSRVDERSDVYGASAVIAQLLTGARPSGSTDWPALLEGATNARLATALCKGLSPNPGDRHDSIVDWQADLRRAIRAADDHRAMTKPRRRWSIPAGVTAVLAIVAGTMGLMATQLGEAAPDGGRTQRISGTTETTSESEAIVAATEDALPPPFGLTAEVQGTSARVTWMATPEADSINLFAITNDGGTSRVYRDTVPASRTWYSFHNLEPDTAYRLTLEALTADTDERSIEVGIDVQTGSQHAMADGQPGTKLLSLRSELCAAVDDQSQVVQADCAALPSRNRWDLVPTLDEDTVTIMNRSTGQCLGLGERPPVGSEAPIPIVLTGCDDSAEEFRPQLLRGVHELHPVSLEEQDPWCLDVLRGSEDDAIPLVAFPCTGAMNQRWVANGL